MDVQRNRTLCLLFSGWTLTLLSCLGCISLTSNLIHAFKGSPKVPAAFDGLKNHRVALICLQADLYGTGGSARAIARNIERILAQEVEGVQMVGQDAVEDWLDHNDWNQINFNQIGRGLKADYVVAVELNRPITLNEGPTLFKGRADFTVTVHDIGKNGEVVMRKQTPEFSWPANGRYGVSEATFERLFLGKLAENIARYFHEYELNADIGSDLGGVDS